MTSPDISVIIPVYNRGDIIRHTLASLDTASVGLTVETIIVDDGSTVPVAESFARLGYTPARLIRQTNQGLLSARLTGFAATTGRYILFLDSDDLISPEKLRLQIAAMRATDAAVSYTDTAHCTLDESGPGPLIADVPALTVTDSATFHILVQPAPHSPIYRRDYLERVVSEAVFPPSPLYNSVAEIWFYHNAALHPALVVHVPGAHTIVGMHTGVRLTNHWEKLAAASLAVMEGFARGCPSGRSTAPVRQLVAEKAFNAWRALPRDFSQEFCRRELSLWRRLHSSIDLTKLGGSHFQKLARLIGPITAARLFRLLQNRPYERIRTLDDATFARLLAALPAP
jgi:hypothetical protein